MVYSSYSTGLSGLLASTTRLSVSASNVANQHSTVQRVGDTLQNQPYVPGRVVQTSQNPGTKAIVQEKNPASRPIFDPGHIAADEQGVVDAPLVSLEQEAVLQIRAEHAYKASLKTIETQQEMDRSTLDMA